MKQSVRLGAGSGFWGDAIDPALELLESAKLDYLGMDYLAELTMALLQRLRKRDPSSGYIPDLPGHMRQLLPAARDHGTRIVCNAGGANPAAGAEALCKVAREIGLKGNRIALVEGDDFLDRIDELIASGLDLRNLDTGETELGAIRKRIVAANVYTDASGIAEALTLDAQVIVTGRVSDNALFVGPIMHEFGWTHDAAHADRIASAITAGHVIECAAACTGGMSSRFDEMPAMGRVGFPIIEMDRSGVAVLSKLPGTGGRIDAFTVKEHLVYEIGDPARYVMPDGIADFTRLRVTDLGEDRVRLDHMGGEPQPDTLKLVIGYEDGWIGEGMLFFPWPRAYDRAVKAKETLLQRFERMGLTFSAIQFDFVGLNMLHGPAAPVLDTTHLNEVGLRVAVHTKTREEADKVRRACSHLWIMGPGGTSFGTPMKARPVVSLWPTLIPRELVTQSVRILEA